MLRDGVGSLPPVLCLRDHDPEQEPLVALDPALHDEVDSEVEFEFIELPKAFMSEEEEGIVASPGPVVVPPTPMPIAAKGRWKGPRVE